MACNGVHKNFKSGTNRKTWMHLAASLYDMGNTGECLFRPVFSICRIVANVSVFIDTCKFNIIWRLYDMARIVVVIYMRV